MPRLRPNRLGMGKNADLVSPQRKSANPSILSDYVGLGSQFSTLGALDRGKRLLVLHGAEQGEMADDERPRHVPFPLMMAEQPLEEFPHASIVSIKGGKRLRPLPSIHFPIRDIPLSSSVAKACLWLSLSREVTFGRFCLGLNHFLGMLELRAILVNMVICRFGWCLGCSYAAWGIPATYPRSPC